jgi:hypothetical protein
MQDPSPAMKGRSPMKTRHWILTLMLLPTVGCVIAGVVSTFAIGGIWAIGVEYWFLDALVVFLVAIICQVAEKRVLPLLVRDPWKPFVDGSFFPLFFAANGILFWVSSGIDWWSYGYDILKVGNVANGYFAVTFFFSTIGVIYYFGKVISQTAKADTRKGVFYIFATSIVLLMIFLSIFSALYGRMLETWYGSILTIRGAAKLTNPSTAIVHFPGWPGKEKFLGVLTILRKYKPQVIGVTSALENYLPIDSVFARDYEKAIDGIETVFLNDSRRQLSSPYESIGLESGTTTIDMFAYYPERPRYRPTSLPLLFRPPRSEVKNLRGNPNEDLGIKLYGLLITRDRGPAGLSASPWNSGLPVNKEGKTIIKHYDEPPLGNRWRSAFPTYEFQVETGPYSLDHEFASLHGPPGLSEYRFDFTSNKLIQYSTLPWTYSELGEPAEMRNIKGKALLICIGGSDEAIKASTYASIIQSLVDQSFVREPSLPVQIMVAIVFVIVILILYARTNHWTALIASVLIVLCLLIVAGSIFYIFQILYNPGPLLLGFVIASLFFFPYESAVERRKLFEEQTRLASELKTAHDLQMGLMPMQDPEIPSLEVSGVCIPANEVGGDFFDYVWLDGKHTKFGVAVADVSGKAMKAAMTAVLTSGMLYSEVQRSKSPREILSRLNNPLYFRSDRRIFTAFSFAVFDLRTKRLAYSSAGQTLPMIVRNDNLKYLEMKGMRLPLGLQSDVEYKETKYQLRKGDTILFYTDGLTEAMNAKKEMFGFERLERALLDCAGLSAKEVRERIAQTVKTHVGNVLQHDDMTVVVVRVL